MPITYEEIMGSSSSGEEDPAEALTNRLVTFRKWLATDAKAVVHPAVCIVNGEATDGTKNAPVLVYEKTLTDNSSEGRLGTIDKTSTNSLYDRTMGCQVRAVREIKKDEIMMELPRSSMVTPDLVASSDAGKAILACCSSASGSSGDGSNESASSSFWDAFANTAALESSFAQKLARNSGPQMLVKILQERKRAETTFKKALEGLEQVQLAGRGTISTRAPFLAFLIHQRFSDTERTPVVSSSSSDSFLSDSFQQENALTTLTVPIQFPPGAPETFSPYARTLPSCVSLPLCWKRNELALLAGCISGFPVLLEVAAGTLQLVAEFTALVNAGILERFPEIFPPGMITYDRWVWAAAVFTSRILPATSYTDKGTTVSTFHPAQQIEFQSPPDIWGEVGVMVPLLDMLNHEADEHQITWEGPVPEKQSNGDRENGDVAIKPHPPRALVHKKIKKGSEIFCTYGNHSNSHLILQYGFAQVNNLVDEVRIGWSIADAVGNVDPPFDFKPPYETTSDTVFESHDEIATNAWWTEDRLKLLEKEVFPKSEPAIVASIRAGKKTFTIAYRDGTYHPILLSCSVVATMPTKDLHKYLASGSKVVISKYHQQILQRYLQFTFARKLEKLLQNLDNGLKGHFANVKLWTKESQGGLNYQSEEDESEAGYTGWQSFFDANAYKATMEVENRYYAMGSDSCVLAFYDSQLRTLQETFDGVNDDDKFANGVLKQLEDLGFQVSKDDNDDVKLEGNGGTVTNNSPNGSSGSKSPRNRRRNRKKNNTAAATSGSGTTTTGEKAPAIKLHIGNLSFDTTPSDLYDYFSSIYGQDNVLECHIPVERDAGRSRGFGFVAMPEAVALAALQSGRKHEVANRILKVARSNSAGSASNAKPPQGPPPNASDRCLTCGYRPRYCVCPRPKIPGYQVPPPGPYGPPPGARRPLGVDYGPPPPDYGRGPWDYERDRYRDDRRRDYYDDDRHRDYDRDRDRRYRHDDRRSYDRDDDYYYERSRRDRDRGRSRDRSPDSRGSSRRYEDDRSSSRRERSRDRSRDRKGDPDDYDRRKRSRSRSKDKGSRRKKSKRRNRSRSRSASPSP